MRITYAPRDILQIDDARLWGKANNFAGVASKYNREGDRNFAVIIDDQEIADELIRRGWNVTIKPPRDEGDSPFMYLKVKVKYNDNGFGPTAYLYSGGARPAELTEETIGCLDDVEMQSVDLDIRPYDWELNGKTGRSAYLQSIHVTQRVDRFAARYADEPEYN